MRVDCKEQYTVFKLILRCRKPTKANPVKTGDAMPWVLTTPCVEDRQAAEIHKSHLCNFGLAGISQVFLSDAFQAEPWIEHAAWTLQSSQEAAIVAHPS